MTYLRRRLNQANARAAWMTAFERQVIEADAKHAGRIDWDTANYMFNQNMHVDQASRQLASYISEIADMGQRIAAAQAVAKACRVSNEMFNKAAFLRACQVPVED